MNIVIPKNVAETIEYIWEGLQSAGVTKHLALTNWSQLSKDYPEEATILLEYANYNFSNYTAALIFGYTIEFDINKQVRLSNDSNVVLQLNWSSSDIEELKTLDEKITLTISHENTSKFITLSKEDSVNLCTSLNLFNTELKKLGDDNNE